MDEIQSPRLHQWLSCCRVLMGTHPQHGVELLDGLSAVLSASRWRIGWNHAPPHYVFIPPEDSLEPALTTLRPPPPGSPIHEVPPGPSFLSTTFWHTVMPAIADGAVAPELGWTSERIAAVTQGIEDNYRMYGAGGPTPALMDLARPYWQRMMAARDAMATGKLQFKAFLAPAFDLIDSYMNFEIQGNTAAPVLTLLLSLQLNLPTMGSPDTTPPEGRASAVEHLVSVATSMVRERAEVQVTPFFELSYLANLYFMSAFELGQQADESGGLAQDRLRTIEDRVFVGEERRAHEVSPAFVTGASANPCHLLMEKVERRGDTLKTACRNAAAHPALRDAVLACSDPATADPAEIMRDYQRRASSLAPLDVMANLDERFSPTSEDNYHGIQEKTLFLTLAR